MADGMPSSSSSGTPSSLNFSSSLSPSPTNEPTDHTKGSTVPTEIEPVSIDTTNEIEIIEASYTVDHLSAVMRPVMLTMFLASLAVANVRDAIQDNALSSGLSMYLVYDENTNSGNNDNSSTGTMIGQAAINALVIVSVICGATFILVACYYFRCLKLMIGYLIFACANLLGYTGGFMVYTAIQRYQIILDWVTLAFLMYNFAIGGVVAVFWQKGIPRMMTQTYLVAVSVIMAWILSELPEWTSWALLIALALYDLCAVLTPCGPLRALVNLAQERRDPIPGLLYEADVNSSSANDTERSRDTLVPPVRVMQQHTNNTTGTVNRTAQYGRNDNTVPLVTANGYVTTDNPTIPTMAVWERPPLVPSEVLGEPYRSTNTADHTDKLRRIQQMSNSSSHSIPNPAYGNRNALTPPGRSIPSSSVPLSSSVSYHQSTLRSLTHPGTLDHASITSSTEYTALPSSSASSTSSSNSYTKVNTREAIPSTYATGTLPPSLVQEWPPSSQPRDALVGTVPSPDEYEGAEPEEDEDEPEERNIKLGLGDFVFYSVLVSRAAMYDISTAAACFISVIMGLGGTLFLLGIFKKALPALPISIFLGVTFYFITRIVITPMITELIVGGTEIVQ